jgi:hypothetical protein
MAPEGADENRELSDGEPGDVEVFTGVRAEELKFGKIPETKVWFEGEPAECSSSKTERENLPEEVEPGTTYRDTDSADFDDDDTGLGHHGQP